MSEDVAVLILAAGKSTRMQGRFPDMPKVLLSLGGKPMLTHLVEAIEESGIAAETIVVTGPEADQSIRNALRGHQVSFAFQREQLGTGHAVLCCHEQIRRRRKHLIVLCGDHPLFSSYTLRSVLEKHQTGGQPVTMLTVSLPDFDGWRSTFAHCGRILRQPDGSFCRIVEAKDAAPDELAVKEVNPSLYCFRTEWLWAHLVRLTPDNAQAQYYLTDVVGMAVAEGERVQAIQSVDYREAVAANTPEEFDVVRQKYAELNRPRNYQSAPEKRHPTFT